MNKTNFTSLIKEESRKEISCINLDHNIWKYEYLRIFTDRDDPQGRPFICLVRAMSRYSGTITTAICTKPRTVRQEDVYTVLRQLADDMEIPTENEFYGDPA